MKYKLHFLVMMHFVAMQLSYAMENRNNQLQIIRKLTAIPRAVDTQRPNLEHFHAIEYVTNDSVVIGHRNGCSILDINTDKEIKKISDVPCYKVAVHPNQKKIAFSANTTINLYDVETNAQEWSKSEKHYFSTILFNACDNTILLCLNSHNTHRHIVTRRNYSGDRCGDDDINLPYVDVALCPEKQMLCTVELFGKEVSLYNSSNLALESKKIKLERDRYPFSRHMGNNCCTSSEGIIAVGEAGQNFIHIITGANMDKHTVTYLEDRLAKGFLRMLFYPRGSVLLTVSEKSETDKKICYWDVKTRLLIYTADFPFCFHSGNSFSFSPDGKAVAFAFSRECLIFPVPFEVQYDSDIKERFPYLLFLLKKYIVQQDQQALEDVTKLLAYTLFKTFRR